MVIVFGRETLVSLPLGCDVDSYSKQPDMCEMRNMMRLALPLFVDNGGGGSVRRSRSDLTETSGDRIALAIRSDLGKQRNRGKQD